MGHYYSEMVSGRRICSDGIFSQIGVAYCNIVCNNRIANRGEDDGYFS